MQIQIFDRKILYLLLVYLASNGLILLSENLTFDDAHLVWMLKNELQTLYLAQSQYGNTPLYYWEKIFSFFNDPAFYIRLTIFIFNGIGVVYVYRIIKNNGLFIVIINN
jgi:hypothetical protein